MIEKLIDDRKKKMISLIRTLLYAMHAQPLVQDTFLPVYSRASSFCFVFFCYLLFESPSERERKNLIKSLENRETLTISLLINLKGFPDTCPLNRFILVDLTGQLSSIPLKFKTPASLD